MERILIIEDVDGLREVLASVLEGSGYTVDAFSNAEAALESMATQTYSCVLTDFKLPGKNGLQFLEEARAISATVPIILMTAFGSIDIAVRAMKLGANDFLPKPFEPKTLSNIIHDVIEHRRIVDRSLGTRGRRDRTFLTNSPAAQEMLRLAKKAARVDSSILLLGESGTGKELIARLIHEQSPRKNEPFVAVNCAATPPDLLESEFFGHDSGAFTGATQSRVGVFELASSGTIFLDEIGDMPLNLQVKLLRALQEREVKRVGGTKLIKVKPRVIAATNYPLEELLEGGKLREDFYYRLAVITFTIPPLRERPEDVELLVNYYNEYFCNLTGKKQIKISDSAWNILRHYGWPGNARELENVMERAVILAENVIEPDHLGVNIGLDFDSLEEAASSLPEIAMRAARKAEIELITKTLRHTMGNKTKAAQMLGVSYKTLLNKVKEYSLEPTKEHPEEAKASL